MGSRVNVVSANILDNPSSFTDPFKLEITFEAFELLPCDLEWELVYVGSPQGSNYDQVLTSILIGPTPEGRQRFILDANAPDPSKIPSADMIGVTVLLLKVKYNDQEFLNLGWYVKVEYADPELIENPPSTPQVDKLSRTVLTDGLRVTSFAIKWDEKQEEQYPPEEVNPDEDLVPESDDEDNNVEQEKEEEEEEEKEGKDDEEIDLEQSFGDEKDKEEDVSMHDEEEEGEEEKETEVDEGEEEKVEGGEMAGKGDKGEATTTEPLGDTTNV